VATESTTPDALVEGQVGTTVQTPDTPVSTETETQAQATPAAPDNAPSVQAQTEAQINTATPPAPDNALTVPPAQAAANASAMAASPATPATSTAAALPASAGAVCQPRVTSVHFGRASSLSRDNQNALEHAVDAASVCTLESVVIADSREGSRRANAVRQTLIRQGVPGERITIAQGASTEGASTGQLDVRMNFAGVASTSVAAPSATPAPASPDAEEPVESNEAEPTPPPAS